MSVHNMLYTYLYTVCTDVCTHVCAHPMHTSVHMSVHTFVHMYIRLCKCLCTCLCIRLCTCLCIPLCTCLRNVPAASTPPSAREACCRRLSAAHPFLRNLGACRRRAPRPSPIGRYRLFDAALGSAPRRSPSACSQNKGLHSD